MIELKNLFIFLVITFIFFLLYNSFDYEQIFFQNVGVSDVLPIDESKIIGIIFLDDEADVSKFTKQYNLELNKKTNIPMCQIISQANKMDKPIIYHRDDLKHLPLGNFQKYVFGWDKIPKKNMMDPFRIRPGFGSWIRPILNTKRKDSPYFIIGPISWFKKWKLNNLLNLKIYLDFKGETNIIFGVAQGTGAWLDSKSLDPSRPSRGNYIPTQTIFFSSRCIVE
jgi:hypothetical protein